MTSILFQVRGLKITGDESHVQNYANDKSEYDYIKNALEQIGTKVNIKTKENNYIRYARLQNGKHLIAIADKNTKEPPALLVYDVKTKCFDNQIPCDSLLILRNQVFVDDTMESISKKQQFKARMVPELIEKQAWDGIKDYNCTEP